MKSRWKWLSTVEPEREYLLLASSIPPQSRRSTWALFNGSRIVRKQLASTDGVIGFALLAEPIRMRYATLSVWRDEAALDAFAAAGANLVEVQHQREGVDLHVRETGIHATFEVRGRDHAARVLANVRAAGYPDLRADIGG